MVNMRNYYHWLSRRIIGENSQGKFHTNYQPFAELPNVNKLVEKAVNNSFPSDHTIIFFSFCITFWLFKRGWGFLWGILAVLVGISRIWVGVHYPADVLVGAIISIVSATIVYQIVLKLSLTKKFFWKSREGRTIHSICPIQTKEG